MIDLGLLVTGIAAFIALKWGRGKWMRHMLALSWASTLLITLTQQVMALVVFTMTMMDLLIAGVALAIVTHDNARHDAQAVGGISMALMPAHWIMSVSQGEANWLLYATICNAAFVVQCFIVRGWLDGVGRSVGAFIARLSPVRLFRDGG